MASKTGTTDNYRDTWTDGYSPNLAMVVWVGNTNGEPMKQALSSMTAGRIWPQAMQMSFDTLGLAARAVRAAGWHRRRPGVRRYRPAARRAALPHRPVLRRPGAEGAAHERADGCTDGFTRTDGAARTDTRAAADRDKAGGPANDRPAAGAGSASADGPEAAANHAAEAAGHPTARADIRPGQTTADRDKAGAQADVAAAHSRSLLRERVGIPQNDVR